MTQEPIVRHYRGATRPDVEAAYRNEAVQAAEAGYLPVTHQWTTDWQGFLLAVTYRLSVAAAPVERPAPHVPTPQPQAPTAVPPPPPAVDLTPRPVVDEFAPSQPTAGVDPYAGFAPRDGVSAPLLFEPPTPQPVEQYVPQAPAEPVPTPAQEQWRTSVDESAIDQPMFEAAEASYTPAPAQATEPAYQLEPDYQQPAHEQSAQELASASWDEPAYQEPTAEQGATFDQVDPVYEVPAAESAIQQPEPEAWAEPAQPEAASATLPEAETWAEPAYPEPQQGYEQPTYEQPAVQPEPAAWAEPASPEPQPTYEQPIYEQRDAQQPEAAAWAQPAQADPEPIQPPEAASWAEPANSVPEPASPAEPVAWAEPAAHAEPQVIQPPEPVYPPEPLYRAQPAFQEPPLQQSEPVAQPQSTYEPYAQQAAAPPIAPPIETPESVVEPTLEVPRRVPDVRATLPGRHTRLTIQTMDLHCAGEPLRIIRSGFPDVPNVPVLERRRWVMENADHIRRAIIHEPRGHRDMYGAILLPPNTDYADMTVLFMHNEGYSTMCGHGIIAITAGLIEEGLFPATEPVTTIRYEVPAGIVAANAATVQLENGDWAVQGVRFTNVPSYLAAQSLSVRPDGVKLHGSAAQYGALSVDMAFGGAYYGIVNAAELGLRVVPEQAEALRHAGAAITDVLRRDHTPSHPTDPALGFVYGTIIVDLDPRSSPDGRATNAHMRNATIFADAELDRSPCGSGTSAILAQLHARGRIKVGQEIINAGITGEHFLGRVEAETALGPYPAVSTSIAGTAYVTGFSTFLVDNRDPLGEGFLLR